MAADNIQDWMDWASGLTGADQGDPLLTHEEIEAIVDNAVSQFGIFHTDPSTIPTTATARPRGAFSDPNDLQHYLNSGGLLSYDELGQPVPSPIVHVLKRNLEFNDDIIYEVWIDDET